jgi:hypothetical protein
MMSEFKSGWELFALEPSGTLTDFPYSEYVKIRLPGFITEASSVTSNTLAMVGPIYYFWGLCTKATIPYTGSVGMVQILSTGRPPT